MLPGLTLPGLPVAGLPVVVDVPGPPEAAPPITSVRPRRRGPRERLSALGAGVRDAVGFWGRSLRLRVIVLTLLFSSLVMVGVGVVVQQQITAGLLQSKLSAAIGEIEAARIKAETSLGGAESDPTSLKSALNLDAQRAGPNHRLRRAPRVRRPGCSIR